MDDLLDVSRITRGKITLAREPVLIATVLRRAVETVQPLIAGQTHEPQIDMQDQALEVEGDLTRLTQALSNLLNNAVKYTEAGGRINVSVRREDETVEIRVKDSGLGISPELLPRLFNLFTQADTTTHRAQGGLGIGLALVRKLVEMHGGTVAAHSAGVKRGSEFIVRLPLLAQNARRRRTGALPVVARAQPLPRRILVADDNADSLESLAILLRCDGHEVYTAADGEEALQQAAVCRPEVALLDIGMPKLDGVQVGRRIRAESWGQA